MFFLKGKKKSPQGLAGQILELSDKISAGQGSLSMGSSSNSSSRKLLQEIEKFELAKQELDKQSIFLQNLHVVLKMSGLSAADEKMLQEVEKEVLIAIGKLSESIERIDENGKKIITPRADANGLEVNSVLSADIMQRFTEFLYIQAANERLEIKNTAPSAKLMALVALGSSIGDKKMHEVSRDVRAAQAYINKQNTMPTTYKDDLYVPAASYQAALEKNKLENKLLEPQVYAIIMQLRSDKRIPEDAKIEDYDNGLKLLELKKELQLYPTEIAVIEQFVASKQALITAENQLFRQNALIRVWHTVAFEYLIEIFDQLSTQQSQGNARTLIKLFENAIKDFSDLMIEYKGLVKLAAVNPDDLDTTSSLLRAAVLLKNQATELENKLIQCSNLQQFISIKDNILEQGITPGKFRNIFDKIQDAVDSLISSYKNHQDLNKV